MDKNIKDITREYTQGKISLKDVPLNKITWSLLGKAAIREPENYINFVFALCKIKNANIDIMKCIELLPSKYLTQEIYTKVFEINPEKYFIRIPKKYRTHEMHIKFNETKLKPVKSTTTSHTDTIETHYYEIYKKDPENYFEKIPDEYKTRKMCSDFFYIDPVNHFKLIPEKFITRKMCNDFLSIDPVNHFKLIPEKFLTREMCNNFFRIDPVNHFKLIPEKFITREMYKIYFIQEPIKAYELIPEKIKKELLLEHVTEIELNDIEKFREVYKIIFKKNPKNNFSYIPLMFRTQDMYNTIAKDFIDDITLYDIPYDFRTQEIYDIFFERKPCETFMSVPDKFKTQKMCDTVLQIDLVKFFSYVPDRFKNQDTYNKFFYKDPLKNINIIPFQFRTQDMYNTIAKTSKDYMILRDIPYNFRTQEIYNIFFKRKPCEIFISIPDKFKTQEMCDTVLQIDFAKFFPYVPDRFKSQDTYNKFFCEEPLKNINTIPSEFRTQDMYNTIVKNFIDDITLYDIPYCFRTQEIYDIFFERKPCKIFMSVPDKFKTQEMCDTVLQIDLVKFFPYVPDRFKKQEACNKFFYEEPLKNINMIPFEFRTQDMLLEILKTDFTLISVIAFPKSLMTQGLFDELFKYIDPFKFFEYVSGEFKNQGMCEALFNRNSLRAFPLIPDEFKTERMCRIITKNICDINILKCIPNRFHNQKLFDTLFMKDANKYFEYIPVQYRRKEMYLSMLKSEKFYECYKTIPEDLYDEDIFMIVATQLNKLIDKGITISNDSELCMKVIEIYPHLIRVLDESIANNIIINDLYSIVENGGTLEYVLNKYNVTDYYINNLMDLIKENDYEKYEMIKKKLEDNRITWFANMINDVHNLRNIILSIGDLTEGVLNNEQKIHFAYLYGKYIHNDLEEIYNFNYKKYINETKEYFMCIDDFFKRYLNYQRLFSEINDNSEKKLIIFNNSWLKKYNRYNFFKFKNGIASMEYRYGKEEQLLTFEIEHYVINVLKEKSIPLNNIIVKNAFIEYFNGTLDEYVFKLQCYGSKYIDLKIKKKQM